jgi:aryl-alcohol dehydrogenase-like predicted oxidoreductase
MERVKLFGGSPEGPLEVSRVCLGGGGFGGKLSEGQAFETLDAFAAAGGNFIDTANAYCRWLPGKGNCSEGVIGRWLKSRNAYGSAVIATKGGHYDFSDPSAPRVNKREVGRDLDESLSTLGLERVDLYWLHRDDEAKPVEEIVLMMEGFVKAGKIRLYGASNFKLERVEAARAFAARNGLQGFCAVSNQWSLASPNPGLNINPDPTLAFMTGEFYEWHKETKTPAIPYSSTAFGFFEKLYASGAESKGGFLLSPAEGLRMAEGMKKAYVSRRNLLVYEDLLEIMKKSGNPLHALSAAGLANRFFDVVPIGGANGAAQAKTLAKAGSISLGVDLIGKYGI